MMAQYSDAELAAIAAASRARGEKQAATGCAQLDDVINRLGALITLKEQDPRIRAEREREADYQRRQEIRRLRDLARRALAGEISRPAQVLALELLEQHGGTSAPIPELERFERSFRRMPRSRR